MHQWLTCRQLVFTKHFQQGDRSNVCTATALGKCTHTFGSKRCWKWACPRFRVPVLVTVGFKGSAAPEGSASLVCLASELGLIPRPDLIETVVCVAVLLSSPSGVHSRVFLLSVTGMTRAGRHGALRRGASSVCPCHAHSVKWALIRALLCAAVLRELHQSPSLAQEELALPWQGCVGCQEQRPGALC